jgi:cysteine desulfurase
LIFGSVGVVFLAPRPKKSFFFGKNLLKRRVGEEKGATEKKKREKKGRKKIKEKKSKKYIKEKMQIIFAVVILLVILAIFWFSRGSSRQRDVFKKYKYFDANGTTPIHPEALTEYVKSAYMGNPSAGYSADIGSDAVIEDAKKLVKTWLKLPNGEGCGYSIIFNSCASEGNNYVLKCVCDAYNKKNASIPHMILSSLEHKTSLDCAKRLSEMGRIEMTIIQSGVNRDINIADVVAAIKPNTVLISVMHANNETGNLNKIDQFAELMKKFEGRDIFIHSDVVQTIGKYPIPMAEYGLDCITASMHKLYGPVGVGLMVLSPRLRKYLGDCASAQISGTQFEGLRGGTINVAGIAASKKAMEITWKDREKKNLHLMRVREQIAAGLEKLMPMEKYEKFFGRDDKYTGEDLGSGLRLIYITSGESLPNTLLFAIVRLGKYDINDENQRFCNVKLKKALFKRGYVVSIGSACNTKQHGPSHVLKAIGAPFLVRAGTIRISLLDSSSEAGIVKAISESIAEQLSGFK